MSTGLRTFGVYKAQMPLGRRLSTVLVLCNRCAQTLLHDDHVLAFFQHTSLQPLAANNAHRCAVLSQPQAVQTGFVDNTAIILVDLSVVSWQMCRTAGKVHLEVLRRAHAQEEDAAGISTPAAGPFTEQMLAKVKTIVPLVWRCVPCAGPLGFLLQVHVH